jgi:hypothetical protein
MPGVRSGVLKTVTKNRLGRSRSIHGFQETSLQHSDRTSVLSFDWLDAEMRCYDHRFTLIRVVQKAGQSFAILALRLMKYWQSCL